MMMAMPFLPRIPHANANIANLGRALSDGTADALSPLPVVEAALVAGDGLGTLLDNLLTLGKNHLNVARV